MEIIDISSSSEADDYEYRMPRKVNKGKGNAKAPIQTLFNDDTADEVLVLSSSRASSTNAAWRGADFGASSSSKPIVKEPLAQVLEIVPDVDPAFAQDLINQNMAHNPDNVVQTVLHSLFEDRTYPKVASKRKFEQAGLGGDGTSKKAKVEVDYASTARDFTGGANYTELAVEQLALDFSDIPKANIRKLLADKKGFYAPTHLFIADQKKTGGNLGYIPKKTTARPKGKGPVREDECFNKERAWLVNHLRAIQAEEAELAEGKGVECGCCFTEYPFHKMVQCPDAHLFCSECVTQYASTQLGGHDPSILCMDQSGCKHPFPETELRRLLSPKLWQLYERVKTRKEIEAAGLEGLEECPFCEYKCVIENQEEKLFRCGNEETCGAITCRNCKKPDHLPKSCKEIEDDKHLDGRHLIEEAMTKALMRNCPKCTKAFIKDAGCNKMVCPNCATISCYVCRSIITGYEHFNQLPIGHPRNSASSKKCLLWDNVDARHSDEVKAAAEKALAQYRVDHPDVGEDDVHVDLPPPPPAAPTALTNAFYRYAAVDLAGQRNAMVANWAALHGNFFAVPPPAIPAPRQHRHVYVPPLLPPPRQGARRRR